ncbi:MAG TPA: 2-isopropylmalate synthase [Polyangia bacterium]|jgi:2-isopropylmalate synthase|nr:2-isopropylmalate synthase [Polyangia bacterium]
MTMTSPDRVHIFDTTLRDGEQAPGCSMTVSEKLRMAEKLAELGVDIMEAGFPIASAGDFEAVQKVSREVSVRVAALARATALDVERAVKALEGARVAPRIHVFLATSDVHLKYKLKKTRAQVLDEAAAAVALARKYVGDVEFSAEDGGRTPVDYLIEVSRAVVAAGATTVNIPDTVGYGIPEEYGALIGQVARALGNSAIVSVHCHNDLGLAVANSLAAIQNGARQVECTVNGIGERAGNCSLEEIVMVLKTRADRLPFATGIKTEQLFPASQLLSEIIGVGVQPNKAIVGANAFAHEAGIHQDGFLKERTTYEIIEPASVGVPQSRLVLGKHSGRHALGARCKDLGLALDKPQLDEVYTRFTALADRQKGITDDEIRSLASKVQEDLSRKIA